jgi:hypothetical protein
MDLAHLAKQKDKQRPFMVEDSQRCAVEELLIVAVWSLQGALAGWATARRAEARVI